MIYQCVATQLRYVAIATRMCKNLCFKYVAKLGSKLVDDEQNIKHNNLVELLESKIGGKANWTDPLVGCNNFNRTHSKLFCDPHCWTLSVNI